MGSNLFLEFYLTTRFGQLTKLLGFHYFIRLYFYCFSQNRFLSRVNSLSKKCQSWICCPLWGPTRLWRPNDSMIHIDWTLSFCSSLLSLSFILLALFSTIFLSLMKKTGLWQLLFHQLFFSSCLSSCSFFTWEFKKCKYQKRKLITIYFTLIALKS